MSAAGTGDTAAGRKNRGAGEAGETGNWECWECWEYWEYYEYCGEKTEAIHGGPGGGPPSLAAADARHRQKTLFGGENKTKVNCGAWGGSPEGPSPSGGDRRKAPQKKPFRGRKQNQGELRGLGRESRGGPPPLAAADAKRRPKSLFRGENKTEVNCGAWGESRGGPPPLAAADAKRRPAISLFFAYFLFTGKRK